MLCQLCRHEGIVERRLWCLTQAVWLIVYRGSAAHILREISVLTKPSIEQISWNPKRAVLRMTTAK
jgi:hypothetical protein